MRALRKSVCLGALVLSLGASAFGCGGSDPSQAASSDEPYSKAYTVQASPDTRAATGVASWSVHETATGIHVDGNGPSNETIVAWNVVRKNLETGYETRYGLQVSKKASTMIIDVTDTEIAIRDNTFFGNKELASVLDFLATDLKQQATPSAGTSGPSSLSTQSLSPKDGSLVPHPGSDNTCNTLVAPTGPNSQDCKVDTSSLNDTETGIGQHCGPICPTTHWLRWYTDFAPYCENCATDLGNKDDYMKKKDKSCGSSNPCPTSGS
jgi:hypothetical protein